MGTMPEQVHLLRGVPSTVALWPLIQQVKGTSSRRLRRELPPLRWLPALWSRSWFVCTVGGAPLEVVRCYGENQKLAG